MTGSPLDRPNEARVGATHLYPGTRLTLPGPGDARELTLLFSDGSTAAAELVEGVGGRRLLRVNGYRTGRGPRCRPR